jgi:uncharacterized protein YeaO (DUF488 family)
MSIFIKRVYEPHSTEDGFRILVDRLWPRGVKKQDARIDEWLKDVAPSNELRKWFNHEPEKWKAFTEKYAGELRSAPAYKNLQSLIEKHRNVTLVYGARDEHFNQAVALQQMLRSGS